MEPSPISVEATHAPEFPLKGRTALTEALEDVLYGSVCVVLQPSLNYTDKIRWPAPLASTSNTLSTQSKFDYRANPIISLYDILVPWIVSDNRSRAMECWDFTGVSLLL
jgi:hypothetical protein